MPFSASSGSPPARAVTARLCVYANRWARSHPESLHSFHTLHSIRWRKHSLNSLSCNRSPLAFFFSSSRLISFSPHCISMFALDSCRFCTGCEWEWLPIGMYESKRWDTEAAASDTEAIIFKHRGAELSNAVVTPTLVSDAHSLSAAHSPIPLFSRVSLPF